MEDVGAVKAGGEGRADGWTASPGVEVELRP